MRASAMRSKKNNRTKAGEKTPWLKRFICVAASFALAVSLVPVSALTHQAEAAEGDFTFKVEYYANLDTLITDPKDLSGRQDQYAALSIIDTEGGKLPTNTKDPATKKIYVKKSGTGAGQLQYKTVNTEIYKSSTFNYYEAPVLECFDKVTEAENGFTLAEVWVKYSKDGSWTKYQYKSDEVDEHVHFTNNSALANKTDTVLLKEGAIVRLVYDRSTDQTNIPTTFYDYDITDGKYYKTLSAAEHQSNDVFKSEPADGTNVYANTKSQGINSDANYKDSGAKLAFGNENTGTFLGGTQWWNKNLINGYNKGNGGGTNNGYEGCTFGLAKSLSGGVIQYANGVVAPKLFNDGNAIGKTTVTGKSLVFDRDGDTYTLTAVANGTASGSAEILSRLDRFNNPKCNGTTYTHIWTNNFWPMDDAVIGANNTGKDFEFGDYRYEGNRLFIQAEQEGSTDNSFPPSDDGKDHNSFFGMNYSVNFTIDDDYTGPLEYLFFGDDDMWVFLDDKLVCDIGGVHSSVGEYVNLWDYIEGGKDNHKTAEHTLSFFYTERGASGSTCFMQFTLPGVTEAQPYNSGSIEVVKDAYTVVNGVESNLADAATAEYEFKVDLATNSSYSNKVICNYPYAIYEGGKVVGQGIIDCYVAGGNIVKLKDGQSFKVDYLPVGTYYKVTEINVPGNLETKVDGQTGVVAAGRVTEVGKTTTYEFDNVLKTGSLAISKTVEGNAGDATKTWEFKVQMKAASGVVLANAYPYVLENADGTTTEGTLALNDGKATVNLKHGQTMTVNGLPVGTECSVEEKIIATDGYATSVNVTSDKVIIASNAVSAYNFTNEKNIVSVTKTWNDDDNSFTGDAIKVQLMQDGEAYGEPVELNAGNGWSYTWDTFNNGLKGDHVWTVEELDVPYGYAPVVTKTSDDAASAGLAYNISNDLQKGSLAISKTVTGNTGDKNADWEFEVQLTATGKGTIELAPSYGYRVTGSDAVHTLALDANGKGTIVLKHGQTATISGLPIGTAYTVTELGANTDGTANEDGYLTYVVGNEGVIPDDGTAKTVSFTNDKNTVSVTKNWDDGDNVYTGKIKVELRQTKNGDTTVYETVELSDENNWSKTWTGLASGYVWSINEVGVPAGYYLSNITPDGNSISFEEEGPAEFALTNTAMVSAFSLTKRVTGNAGDRARTWDFNVNLTAPANMQLAGSFPCEVYEDGVKVNDTTLTLTDGVGLIELSDGQTAVVSQLPHGTAYVITEKNASATKTAANGEGYFTYAQGTTGSIDATSPVQLQATFTNEKNTVTVVKDFDHGDNSFTGTVIKMQLMQDGSEYGDPVELTAANQWSYTWEDLAGDHEWTVEEVDVPFGYEPSVEQTSSDAANAGLAYEVTNTLKTGSLAISKTVTGNTGDKNADWKFNVVLTAPEQGSIALASSYAYKITNEEGAVKSGTLDLDSGAGQITLKHGETAVIDGLPIGTTYAVTEVDARTDGAANASGYFTIVGGGNGTIAEGQQQVASFTNDKNTVSVEKVWNDGDNTYSEPITVQLSKTKNGETTVHDTVELSDENNWSKTWDGLSSEYFWSVDEAEVPEGYVKKLDYYDANDGSTVFVIENTLQTDVLCLEKTVIGNAGDIEKDWIFDISLNNVKDITLAPAYVYEVYDLNGYMVYRSSLAVEKGKAFLELAHGEMAIIKGIPHGTEYSVVEREAGTEETTTYGYFTYSENAEGCIDATDAVETKVSFTNDKNVITVQKIWEGAGYEYTGSVQVQLLADGEPCGDPVSLNADNQWTHTWVDLKTGPEWMVVELAEDGSYQIPDSPEDPSDDPSDVDGEGNEPLGLLDALGFGDDDAAENDSENEPSVYTPIPGFELSYGEPTNLDNNGGERYTVINTMIPGDLEISKTVVDNPADEQKDWTFKVVFKGAENIELADEYDCVISPLVKPEDSEGSADAEGSGNVIPGGDVIGAGSVLFASEDTEGAAPDGEAGAEGEAAAEPKYEFKRTLTGDLELTLTLKHNEKAVIYGLPHGTTYKVTELEANDGGYKTSVNGESSRNGVASGTIEAKGVSTADYVNVYDPILPKAGDSQAAIIAAFGALAIAGLGIAVLARRRIHR